MALTYGPSREVDRGLGATVVPLKSSPLTLENHYSILRNRGFIRLGGKSSLEMIRITNRTNRRCWLEANPLLRSYP